MRSRKITQRVSGLAGLLPTLMVLGVVRTPAYNRLIETLVLQGTVVQQMHKPYPHKSGQQETMYPHDLLARQGVPYEAPEFYRNHGTDRRTCNETRSRAMNPTTIANSARRRRESSARRAVTRMRERYQNL